MKISKLKPTLTYSLLGLLLATSSTNAATMIIDWSTTTTVSNPASDGKFWNSLGTTGTGSDLAATALLDTSNTATGISVAVNNVGNTGINNGAGFGGNAINGPAGADPFDEAGAITDGIFANNNSEGTSTITFTGLTASTQYDFSAIGGRNSGGANGLITLNQGTSGSGTYNLLNDGTISDFSITSTAGGVIEFNFSETSNDTDGATGATFNALSVTAVPEPSTAFLGLGTLGILFLRRRRSH